MVLEHCDHQHTSGGSCSYVICCGTWHFSDIAVLANVRFARWSEPIEATLYLRGKRWSVAMDRGFRRGFTAAEEAELWDRWQRGESLKAIGRAFGKPSSSIYFQVAPHGGIRPAARRRSRLALTLSEREEISKGITAHQPARSIARLLGRSPSTVSREIARNGDYDRYRAAPADENAWIRARRPKRCKLANNGRLRQAVVQKLRLNWAPEQIAGCLKELILKTSVIRCHTKRSIAVYLFKPAGCLRKSCCIIFDRSARSVDQNRRGSMAMGGGQSRIPSRSVSDRRRLKIGRCLAIGKAISCPGRRTAISRPWSNVIPAT
jgi:DNA-binding CsgD family transcriptional regulator